MKRNSKHNEDMMFIGIDGFEEIESIIPERNYRPHTPAHTKEAAKRAKLHEKKKVKMKTRKALRAAEVTEQSARSGAAVRPRRIYKKRAVLAVAASVTAVMLSFATVANAMCTGDLPQGKQPAPSQPAAALCMNHYAEEEPADIIYMNDDYEEDAPFYVLYIEDEYIGIVDDVDALREALDQILLDAREGYDDETTTEFANKVEIIAYYPDDDEEIEPDDVDDLMEETQDMYSIRLETDWFDREEIPYETEITYDPTLPDDYEEITQEGQNGLKYLVTRFSFIDGEEVDSVYTGEKIISEPVTEKKIVGGTEPAEDETAAESNTDAAAESDTASDSAADPEPVGTVDADTNTTDSSDSTGNSDSDSSSAGKANGLFIWPLPHTHNITSPMAWRWGRMHNGIDIAGGDDYGQPFLAADGGTVIWAGNDGGGYGNYVMIDHGNGYVTVYGHASELNCVTGQTVSQGEVIGLVGSTGNSTGPHLHFEIRLNDECQDPLNYVS